ncbi:ATP-binding protein [Magnetococcales bacterium HHB-1]
MRSFLLIFLPLASLFSLAAWIPIIIETRLKEKDLQAQHQLHLMFSVSHIKHNFTTAEQDLLFLSRLPSLRSFIRENSRQAYGLLVGEFRDLAQSRQVYDQIRLINAQGQELIRIQKTPYGIVTVPEEQRQNKKARYYFTETISLPANRIFISPFDLNVEQGKVETPYNPVLRLATPIKDASGKPRGIVVLNRLAAPLLDGFREAMHFNISGAMLLNEDGYWLVSPNPGEQWGNQLEHGRRFQDRFPQAWELIQSKHKGVVTTSQGLFSFLTIDRSEIKPFAHNEALIRRGNVSRHAFNHIKAVSWVPPEEIPSSSPRHHAYIFSMLMLLLVALAWGTFYLINKRAKNKLLRQEVSALDSQLVALFNLAPLGILICDENGVIHKANSAFFQLLGFEDSTNPPRVHAFWDCVHAAEMMRMKQTWRKLHEEGTDRSSLQVRFDRRDGAVVWTDVHMRRLSLMEKNEKLFFLIIRDLTVERRIEAEVIKKKDELETRERNRFNRKLHDGPLQSMQVLLLEIQNLNQTAGADIQDCPAKLYMVSDRIKDIIEDIRFSIQDSHAMLIEKNDLAGVIRMACWELAERTIIEVDFLQDGVCYRLESMVVRNVYKIFQEALSNALRHSGSRTATVSLLWGPGERLLLEVADQGRGFDMENISKSSLGLGIMRDRASRIGGKLRINSKIGAGAIVSLEIGAS